MGYEGTEPPAGMAWGFVDTISFHLHHSPILLACVIPFWIQNGSNEVRLRTSRHQNGMECPQNRLEMVV